MVKNIRDNCKNYYNHRYLLKKYKICNCVGNRLFNVNLLKIFGP